MESTFNEEELPRPTAEGEDQNAEDISFEDEDGELPDDEDEEELTEDAGDETDEA